MAEQPNILLIHWHDVGRHLGAYGRPDVPSPNVDALAADGVRFDQAYCTAPLCSPARGSLFTGRYPHSNGLMGLSHVGWEYAANERTLPMELGEAGYRTTLIGLQHESSDPRSLGFDEVQHLVAPEQYAGAVAELAAVHLKDVAAERQPFFLTVGFFEPHRPYPEALYEHADPAEIEVPAFLPDTEAVRRDLAGFHGAIATADAATGMVLDALDTSGLADDTVVVFTSDHGMAFPRAKSTLYDPGLEVALIVRLPEGLRRRGEATDQLVSHVDVMPTLLELAGVDPPERIQGRSFAPWLRGEPYVPRLEIHAEKNWHDPDQYDPIRCVRTERYKYIRSFEPRLRTPLPGDIRASLSATSLEPWDREPRAAVELYDLEADPLERHNLAGDPTHAEVESDLAKRLDVWRRDTQDPLLVAPIPPPRRPGRLPGTPLSGRHVGPSGGRDQ